MFFQSHLPSPQNGFTLIELLLYVSIAGIILLSLSVFLASTMYSRVKNQTIAEVEQQGIQVMELISQTIRNTEAINSPTTGTSASLTSLDVVTAANDPTVFDLLSGAIRITEGAGSAVSLTNSRVTASGLTFYNLSRSGTPGIIRVQFTLTHQNPEGRSEYDFNKTFYTSAALRHQ
jgi:prepilin-type N-terminal cleavage/methylation domain-containing protein